MGFQPEPRRGASLASDIKRMFNRTRDATIRPCGDLAKSAARARFATARHRPVHAAARQLWRQDDGFPIEARACDGRRGDDSGQVGRGGLHVFGRRLAA